MCYVIEENKTTGKIQYKAKVTHHNSATVSVKLSVLGKWKLVQLVLNV